MRCFVLLFLFSVWGNTTGAQTSLPSVNSSTDHELISKYLSDTRDAGRKIHELDSLALHCSGEVATPIYQVALSLVPYVKHDFKPVALLYAHFAGMLFGSGAVDLAISYEKEAWRLYRLHGKPASDDSYNMLGTVGSYYLHTSHLDSAEVYYQRAIREAHATDNQLWISASYNNMGMLELARGSMETARSYYDSALLFMNKPRDLSDSMFLTSVIDNLAELAATGHDYTTAMGFYRQNQNLAELLHDSLRLMVTARGMTNIHLAQNDLASAKVELEKLDDLFRYIRFSDEDSLRLFETYRKWYQGAHDYRMADETGENIRQLMAANYGRRLAGLNRVTEALTYSRLYQYSKDIELFQKDLSHEKLVNRQRLIIMLLGIAAALVFFALFRNFYRSRAREHQREIELQKLNLQLASQEARMRELEQERISRELDYRKKDLADLGLYVGKLKDLYDTMSQRLSEIKNKPHEEQRDALRKLTNELSVQIQSQGKHNLIQENVAEVNKELNARIMSKYPNITSSELELCGFIRLNLSNKEIAALKNISQESAKMARYRLRKKMGLQPEEDIYRFISTI